MEASFRRAEEEERKFKEKQAKKEEAARAKAAASAVLGAKAAPAAPFKRTHKIIATRDKQVDDAVVQAALALAAKQGVPGASNSSTKRANHSGCDKGVMVEW